MTTECGEQKLLFQKHGSRTVKAVFDGGLITSDGGSLLLDGGDVVRVTWAYARDSHIT
jgi:hypothetical protein